MSLDIGDIIDNKYRIIRLIGEGGMGAVYEGENTRIHRKVAIKILHAKVAGSDDAVRRFEQEAQAAGHIGSEHIVEVLDLGDLPGGERYMVMEFLEGEDLSARIEKKGRLSEQTTATVVLGILEGLVNAHAAGIIHRDLKPDNIFLVNNKNESKDFVKIVDFGISKFATLDGEFSMTQTGAVMGTPYYLSPEQAKGQKHLDERADLYAVGVIMYEATAGRVPFEGETFNELLFKIVLEPMPPLDTLVPDIDREFGALVAKSMAREADDRFQTASEMKQALNAWLESHPEGTLTARTHASTLGHPAVNTQSETLASNPTPFASTDSESPQAPSRDSNHRTHGAWTNTRADGTRSRGSKRNVILAAILISSLGAGIFAIRSEQNNTAATEAAARAQTQQAQEAASQKVDQEMARLKAEKAQAEKARAQADRARQQAERIATEAKRNAAQQDQELLEKQNAEALAKKKQRAAASKRALHRRQTTSSSSKKPEQPKAAPVVSGRKIRTDI